MDIAAAWLVITRDGFRAVFLERANAEKYAACSHGTVEALFAGTRKHDGPQAPRLPGDAKPAP